MTLTDHRPQFSVEVELLVHVVCHSFQNFLLLRRSQVMKSAAKIPSFDKWKNGGSVVVAHISMMNQRFLLVQNLLPLGILFLQEHHIVEDVDCLTHRQLRLLQVQFTKTQSSIASCIYETHFGSVVMYPLAQYSSILFTVFTIL